MLAGDPSRKEIISQFHPLVRFISDRISETTAQIRPAVSVRISGNDSDPSLGPGIYVLAASLWSVRGLRNVEKLVYEAVPLNRPETLLGENVAESLAIVCASKGRHWLEAGHDCDLKHVHEIANHDLFGVLDERFELYVKEERAQNEDRADIQDRNLDRHFCKQQEAIRRAINTLKEKGRTNLIPAQEGRMAALEDRYKGKKLEIKARRELTHHSAEICVAAVLIE